jgi:hypothetical protein
MDEGVILADIEQALAATQGNLPEILAAIGAVYPPAAALAKFLPLIEVAIKGVQTVQQATGHNAAHSVQAVIEHLTPGDSNAPDLNG